MPFDNPIGIDNDKSGPYIGKDLVFAISYHQIAKYFGLIKNIHLAHVMIEFTLWHLKRIFEICGNLEFAIGGVCLILNLIILQNFVRKGLKVRNIKVFIWWR